MRIAVAGGTGTVGRHVAEQARERGHEVVVLSRSHGVDVRSGQGLAEALEGTDVVIDTAHPDTIEQGPAAEFFTEVAGVLQRACAGQGVGHIVTLSIVGIDKTSFGYYAAKREHERAAASGPVPSTIMRATQFHELPAQLIATTRDGSHAGVLDLQPVQTVAARTVGGVLVELAEAPPGGRAADLGGPQRGSLVELAREFVARRGEAIDIDPVRVDGIPAGALLPADGARIQGPSFEQWLASSDAAAITV
jgi:uncharacterized protein YbjT (DUF2867 family)